MNLHYVSRDEDDEFSMILPLSHRASENRYYFVISSPHFNFITVLDPSYLFSLSISAHSSFVHRLSTDRLVIPTKRKTAVVKIASTKRAMWTQKTKTTKKSIAASSQIISRRTSDSQHPDSEQRSADRQQSRRTCSASSKPYQ